MSPKVTKRTRRLFTPEFKAEAVRLVRESKEAFSQSLSQLTSNISSCNKRMQRSSGVHGIGSSPVFSATCSVAGPPGFLEADGNDLASSGYGALGAFCLAMKVLSAFIAASPWAAVCQSAWMAATAASRSKPMT
jgi:hypothetical protein